MRTEDLILLIEKDAKVPPRRSLILFVILGVISAFIALFLLPLLTHFGIRPDYLTVIRQGFVPIKQLLPLLLAAPLFPLVKKLDNPLTEGNPWALAPFILLAVSMFGIGYLLEPEGSRSMAVVGKSLSYCLTLLPVFALPSFVMIFAVLRSGAPSRPSVAGFYAGMLAGAIGCFVYAFTCIDDNPLFWSWAYSLGMIICGALGALLGRIFLKW